MGDEKFAVAEAAMRQVLRTGVPLVDQSTIVGRTPADPEHQHAWSISVYRLEDTQARVLEVADLQVLQHLDKITSRLEQYIATCVYATYDPHRAASPTRPSAPLSSSAAASTPACSTCPPAPHSA